MTNRAIFILLLIFIILLGAVSFSWWGRKLTTVTPSGVTEIELNLSSLTESTVQSVSIKKGTEDKILVKEGSFWRINNFNASPSAVKEFFKDLSNIKVTELASKNPANHKNFEITDEDGWTLSISTAGGAAAFIIGKDGKIMNSFYIRKKGENNVYLALGTLQNRLKFSVSDWRDKTILRIAKDEIQKIEIESKTSPLFISKNQDGKWFVSKTRGGDSIPLDDSVENSLFTALNLFEGYDFLKEDEVSEFEKSADKTIFRVFNNNGDKLAELLLLDKGDTWWGKPERGESIYKIAKYRVSDIIPPYEMVFKDSGASKK